MSLHILDMKTYYDHLNIQRILRISDNHLDCNKTEDDLLSLLTNNLSIFFEIPNFQNQRLFQTDNHHYDYPVKI